MTTLQPPNRWTRDQLTPVVSLPTDEPGVGSAGDNPSTSQQMNPLRSTSPGCQPSNRWTWGRVTRWQPFNVLADEPEINFQPPPLKPFHVPPYEKGLWPTYLRTCKYKYIPYLVQVSYLKSLSFNSFIRFKIFWEDIRSLWSTHPGTKVLDNSRLKISNYKNLAQNQPENPNEFSPKPDQFRPNLTKPEKYRQKLYPGRKQTKLGKNYRSALVGCLCFRRLIILIGISISMKFNQFMTLL